MLIGLVRPIAPTEFARMDHDEGAPRPEPHAGGPRPALKDAVLPPLDPSRELWRDRSLTALLAMQLTVIFGLVPATAAGLPFPPVAAALLLLAFTSLTIIVAQAKWTLVAGVGTLVPNLAIALLQAYRGGARADVALNLSTLATSVVLSVVVGLAVFRPGHFTGHRIRGAVVLYLNLGLSFAFLHRVVAELVPAAYANAPGPDQVAAFRAAFDYFSFVTLTSVGYGDVVPVPPLARSLSTLEAATGQLLPTLLIGRVLSLSLMERA